MTMFREDTRREEYRKEVSSEHSHTKMTNGLPLPPNPERAREEELCLHQLRIDRLPSAARTRYKHGTAASPICANCSWGREEDSWHIINECSKREAERRQFLGSTPESTPQTDPDSTLWLSYGSSRVEVSPPKIAKRCKICGEFE